MTASDPQSDVRGEGFLRGLSVLELGDGLAGAATTAVLAGFGALVTTVIDPTAAHRRGRPNVALPEGPGPSLLSLLLDRDKRLVEMNVDSLEALGDVAGLREKPGDQAVGFDLVVTDRVSGPPYQLGALRESARYTSWVDSVNRSAWLSISAFGLSGPRSDDFATELTLNAASSLLSLVSDPDTGRPLKFAGNQALLNAAQAAALAACHAVDLARNGEPVHLDASALEAGIAMGPVLALTHLLLNSGEVSGAKRYGAPASFYPCRDGLVRISAMEDHQWQGVVRAMGSPAWASQFVDTSARIERSKEIDALIAAWTREQEKSDAEATLQREGVPATSMLSPAEILESPQLAHRGSLEYSALSEGVTVRSIGRSFPDAPAGSIPSADAPRHALRGLRVLEASHVLAIPLAGALLGALGADVVKLEDCDRIDMYRRRGPYIDAESGINRAAYFSMVNHSKSSLAVDVDSRAGTEEVEEALADADVVIENVGTRKADRLGITEALHGRYPALLAVSSSGFGSTGPYARYRAYAYNLQSWCGLGYLTRNDAGKPAEIDLPWADLVSGYATATIVAAWAVGPSGNWGTSVDYAMAEQIAARFNEFLAAASIDPESDQSVDRANEVTPYAPNGVYRAADGWLALSVDDGDTFEALCEVLGIDDAASFGPFATLGHSRAKRRDLDTLLEHAFETQTCAAWIDRLRAVGTFVERVCSVGDLLTDPQLVSRDFFSQVEHPEWGRRRIIGIPWRPVGQPSIALGPPPLLIAPDRDVVHGASLAQRGGVQ
jgi:crotonobetainyl-CoA:carnitine CoA-transferase CaiB-like acyl-CoA transferase